MTCGTRSRDCGFVRKKNHDGSSSDKGAVSNQPYQARSVNLDFPRFDGNEVLQWIFKEEKFFYY